MIINKLKTSITRIEIIKIGKNPIVERISLNFLIFIISFYNGK